MGLERDHDGTIAIVGATGAVGREALLILRERGVHASRVRAMASARSAGGHLEYGEHRLPVEDSDAASFERCGLVLLCADAATSRRLGPRAVQAGAVVVDNSSAYRMDSAVALVVPEINPAALAQIGRSTDRTPRLIANPNCSTVILLVAIEPIRREFGVRAIDVATYQAVSGAGAAGIDELLGQTRDALDGKEPTPRVFAEPCAFNLFSHDSAVDADGVNGEERKMIDESRKILAQPGLRLTPTCVRVPVLRAHTQAITLTLDVPATEQQLRSAYAKHADRAGVNLIDDRAANRFPTPRKATGIDRVLVGRLRPDPAEQSDAQRDPARAHRRWCLLASGDQLRKGAALNAIQIGDVLGLIPSEPAMLIA